MSDLLQNALEFAVQRHKGTDRDGAQAVPYACHPVAVMLSIRFRAGITDETVLAAALLHDTVEDTGTTIQEIESLFGKPVAHVVAQVTRPEPTEDQTNGLDRQQIWELRSKMLLQEIELMDDRARIVKLADRLDNVRESKITRTGKKLERYVKQTKAILKAIPRKTCPSLWDDIADQVKD